MKKSLVLLILSLIAFLLCFNFPLDLTAQCNEPPSDAYGSEYSYQPRDDGKRCEGFVNKDHLGRGFLISGFTYGLFSFGLDKNEVILVKASAKITDGVRVVAKSVNVRTYYQMNSQDEIKSDLKWPVKDVLLPNDFSSDYIGLFGFVTEGDIQWYTPLVFQTTSKKIIHQNNIPILYILATRHLLNVEYWVYKMDGGQLTLVLGDKLQEIHEEEQIPVTLKADPGNFKLVIKGINGKTKLDTGISEFYFKL